MSGDRVNSERVILDLVGFIYDAAGDASRWPAFLDRLGHVLNAPSLSLHVQDVRSQAGNASPAIGIDAGFQRSYNPVGVTSPGAVVALLGWPSSAARA